MLTGFMFKHTKNIGEKRQRCVYALRNVENTYFFWHAAFKITYFCYLYNIYAIGINRKSLKVEKIAFTFALTPASAS